MTSPRWLGMPAGLAVGLVVSALTGVPLVQGAEATKTMKPRLGRATYVGAGKDEGKELPPDPGAWGAMVVIKALKEGL